MNGEEVKGQAAKHRLKGINTQREREDSPRREGNYGSVFILQFLSQTCVYTVLKFLGAEEKYYFKRGAAAEEELISTLTFKYLQTSSGAEVWTRLR